MSQAGVRLARSFGGRDLAGGGGLGASVERAIGLIQAIGRFGQWEK
jgi:hypothetical protein